MPEPASIKEINILFEAFRTGLETRLGTMEEGLEDKLAVTAKGLDEKFGATTKGLGDQFSATIKGLADTTEATAKGIQDKIGVFQTLGATVLGSIGVLILAVGGNYFYINGVKNEITDKLSNIEKAVAVLQTQVQRLNPADVRPVPSPPGIERLAAEAPLVREFIKTGAISIGAAPKYGIGSRLPDSNLKPLPEDLIAKAPAFAGVRYAIDPSTNLIALADASGRVFALV